MITLTLLILVGGVWLVCCVAMAKKRDPEADGSFEEGEQ